MMFLRKNCEIIAGGPSIDPELMLRMLILGYVFGIRSERALVREVQVVPRQHLRVD